ncbi:hypothetical protein [Vibrio porteresiae]|uniref:Uncharacterized protein n=1 Tax=Vibrio porteresiae DSM 19223 TaxID=1123496 RepID=A0ABZ0QJ70_9VIBR|nr:hypothetical protein [Vibrio porteresiae]WPC75545.1 hypothetical protein R8Z52_21705 [Vibrio porteresiae DSM 19223]
MSDQMNKQDDSLELLDAMEIGFDLTEYQETRSDESESSHA